MVIIVEKKMTVLGMDNHPISNIYFIWVAIFMYGKIRGSTQYTYMTAEIVLEMCSRIHLTGIKTNAKHLSTHTATIVSNGI